MDDLLTLADWLTENHKEMSDLCSGTNIDSATQAELYAWFQFRKVCDNDRFPVYFNRQLALYEDQYLALVRAQSVEWDPMVTEYMERQILNAKTGSDQRTGSTSGSKRSSGSGGKTINTSENTGINGSWTEQGYGENQSQEAGSNQWTDEGTGETQTESGTKGLAGTTPDSALYPEGGFPDELKWKYASSQSESKSDATSEESHENSGTGQDQRSGSGSNSYNGSGTNAQNGHATGILTEQDNKSGTENTTGNTFENGSMQENLDSRERYAGRHDHSPQELLEKARNYIKKTNAFMWLLERLDNTFMQVYDV